MINSNICLAKFIPSSRCYGQFSLFSHFSLSVDFCIVERNEFGRTNRRTRIGFQLTHAFLSFYSISEFCFFFVLQLLKRDIEYGQRGIKKGI